jgi:hypothetical protein
MYMVAAAIAQMAADDAAFSHHDDGTEDWRQARAPPAQPRSAVAAAASRCQ